jgi:hypothetical protein
MDIVAVFISENLNLDMARALNILFNDHMVIIESFHSFTLGCVELIHELALVADNTHALATTSKGSLEHDGEADLTRLLEQEFGAVRSTVVTLQNRNTSGLHDLFTLTLGSHLADSRGRRSDKGQTFALNQLNEVSILGQEAISNTEIHELVA